VVLSEWKEDKAIKVKKGLLEKAVTEAGAKLIDLADNQCW
jgi:hypothetical protein